MDRNIEITVMSYVCRTNNDKYMKKIKYWKYLLHHLSSTSQCLQGLDEGVGIVFTLVKTELQILPINI